MFGSAKFALSLGVLAGLGATHAFADESYLLTGNIPNGFSIINGVVTYPISTSFSVTLTGKSLDSLDPFETDDFTTVGPATAPLFLPAGSQVSFANNYAQLRYFNTPATGDTLSIQFAPYVTGTDQLSGDVTASSNFSYIYPTGGTFNGAISGATLVPVSSLPEPASVALLALGAGGIALRRRRHA